MGQQQLLLLVLGIVIVGIAVVAGIQAFSEGKSKSERDAASTDAMRIVSDVQAWKLKPEAFGGGASSATLVTFKDLGYPNAANAGESGIQSADGTYNTISGCYRFKASAATNGIAAVELFLKDTAAATPGACDLTGTAFAEVDIEGTNADDIKWKYN